MKILAAMTAASVLFAVPAFAQQVVTPETTAGVYMSAADVAAAVGKLPKNPLASVPGLQDRPIQCQRRASARRAGGGAGRVRAREGCRTVLHDRRHRDARHRRQAD